MYFVWYTWGEVINRIIQIRAEGKNLGREMKSPAAHMQILSVCPLLVRYLLRDGWWDWSEISWVAAGGLNLGFPGKKSEKIIFYFYFFCLKKKKLARYYATIF
jgi:hypothetical protein